jgi:hypothetical protein
MQNVAMYDNKWGKRTNQLVQKATMMGKNRPQHWGRPTPAQIMCLHQMGEREDLLPPFLGSRITDDDSASLWVWRS